MCSSCVAIFKIKNNNFQTENTAVEMKSAFTVNLFQKVLLMLNYYLISVTLIIKELVKLSSNDRCVLSVVNIVFIARSP